jgi:hypothetical protein
MDEPSLPKPGPLSPAFISSDDAARWAHQRIGGRRTAEYASVILQRLADHWFVASEPVMGKATSFDWNRLLDRDSASGEFIHPAGYRIVASLHSHPDTVAATQRQNPKWTPQQVKAFMSFYSVPDISFNHQDRARFSAAYLSGPDGALLKYQPSGSAAEAGFVHWLDTSGPWASEHAHDGTLEGLYKKLAAVGQLSFLQSSPAWGGSVGAVPADWQPYQPFNAPALPLACGPVFGDTLQALSHAWTLIQRTPTARQQVLILQQTTGDRFVTSEPQPFGALPVLPSGWHLHGFYVHSRPLPGHYPALEDWLYKNFVSPRELAGHIAQFRQHSLGPQPTLGASLYLRLRDEAVLRYRFSGSAAESLLLARDNDGEVIDNGIQAALSSGKRLTRDYVRQVAEAGELSVEKTSALWDRPGVVGAQWQPYADFALPALSGAFLTADDAARHAHERIGARRGHAYGGLVLQRQDGRFVITEPVPVGVHPFRDGGPYPKDRQGQPLILHAGHQRQAVYGSRPAMSVFEPSTPTQYAWRRQEMQVDAQMFHDQDIEALLQHRKPAYLSCAEEGLLAYQLGEPTSLWRAQWITDSSTHDSLIARRLAQGSLKPLDVVRTLTEGGTLRVLQGNAVWGPAGQVEADWAPFVQALGYQRPRPVSHGALFASADAAALDLQGRALHDFGEKHISRYFAFILKADGKDEYLASEPIPVTRQSPLLSLSGLYDGALPEGFSCHGMFYAQPWASRASTAWLERFFIAPSDLSTAIAQARLNAPMPPHGALVYIAPPEGALLRYQSPSARGLFEAHSEADSAEVLQAKLEAGTLMPVQVVRRVAMSGALRVIRTSPCWDREGPVSGLWNPYQHLQRRRLSPAFVSMDDAARYARQRVATDLAQPYGGVILRRDDGWFVATEPLRVPDEVFDIKWVFPDELVNRGQYPVRTSVVARYVSRPAAVVPLFLSPVQAKVYASMFSTRQVAQAMADGDANLHHYLLVSDGALLRLLGTPRGANPMLSAAQLTLEPRHRHDWLDSPLERQLRNAELMPIDYVNRVAASFDLQVVVGSPLWGAPGIVTHWHPLVPEAAPARGYSLARHDPPCSPLFTQADAAARYVHELALDRAQTRFGYVLKARHNGQYTATLPVADAGSGLSRRRVFSDAGYPYGYSLAGLYLRVPQRADFYPQGRAQSGDGIFQGLFSPADLVAAMYQVQATSTQASLPLYLSCADGALLKFVVRDARFVEYGDELKLRLRLLSPTDFIQRMTAAGALSVLVASANWPAETLAQWALGPIHAHGDDAVAYVHGRIGRFSGTQYLGALLENPAASGWVPVMPRVDAGFPSAAAPQLLAGPQWPAGYRLCAAHLVFHAGLDQPPAPAQNHYCQHFVSWRELGFYVHQLKRDGVAVCGFYLSARDGALLSYTPSFSQDEYNLLDSTGKWSAAQGYTAFAPEPSGFIAQLTRIGALRVLRGGDFWRVPTLLGTDLGRPLEPLAPPPMKDEL